MIAGPSCPPLSFVANGIIYPSSCTQGWTPVNETCRVQCQISHEFTGSNATYFCVDHNTWSQTPYSSVCQRKIISKSLCNWFL